MCRKWQARGCLDIPGGSRGLNLKALRNCGPQRTPVGPYPPVSSISLLLPPEAESPPLCPSTCPPGTSVLTSHVPGDPSARLHIVPGVLGGVQTVVTGSSRPSQGQLGDFAMADGLPQSDRSPQASGLAAPPSRRLWALLRHLPPAVQLAQGPLLYGPVSPEALRTSHRLPLASTVPSPLQ